MRICALDQSMTSAGYGCWGPGDTAVASGAWELGSEKTPVGRVCANVHVELTKLHRQAPIDALIWEKPRHLDGWTKDSNARSHELAIGIATHIQSWGVAMGCRIMRPVSSRTWRAHAFKFIKWPEGTDALKLAAMQIVRGFGFKVASHDEAEAILILDWACKTFDLPAPWRAELALAVPA